MVLVVAEGAGQELIAESMRSMNHEDASGNKLLLDVGLWLSQKIKVDSRYILFQKYYKFHYFPTLMDAMIWLTHNSLVFRVLSSNFWLKQHCIEESINDSAYFLMDLFCIVQDHFSCKGKMTINLKYIGKWSQQPSSIFFYASDMASAYGIWFAAIYLLQIQHTWYVLFQPMHQTMCTPLCWLTVLFMGQWQATLALLLDLLMAGMLIYPSM